MKYPNWTDPQFLDANGIGGLNAAAVTMVGSMASMGTAVWAAPGLVIPDTILFAFTGLVCATSFAPGAGLVTSGGLTVYAHGTQTGQDTGVYSTDFSPFVPSTGSVQAILAATPIVIQQDPFPIPGPPPGFSSFNPNYVPTIGYASNTYSLSLAVTTGAVDNVNTFELMRTTLVPGQTTVSLTSTVNQVRAAPRSALPPLVLSVGGSLLPNQAFRMIMPSVGGMTFTLPPSFQVGGVTYPFVNSTSGPLTISVGNPDVIAGFGSGTVSSLTIGPSGAASFWSNAASVQWEVVAGSQNLGVNSLLARPGYRHNPDGSIDQWFDVVATAGGGLQSTVANFPISFPNATLDLGVCFGGNTPPGPSDPGSISIDFRDNSSCTIWTNFATSTTHRTLVHALGY